MRRTVAVLLTVAAVAATLIGFAAGALIGARIVGELTPATDWPDPVAAVMVPVICGAVSAYLIWRGAWRLIGRAAARPFAKAS